MNMLILKAVIFKLLISEFIFKFSLLSQALHLEKKAMCNKTNCLFTRSTAFTGISIAPWAGHEGLRVIDDYFTIETVPT